MDEVEEVLAVAKDFSLSRDDNGFRLKGTVTVPTSGWLVEIREMSGGIVPDPTIVRYFLSVTPPPDDAATADVVTDHPIDVDIEDSDELAQAHVHLHRAQTEDGEKDIFLELAEHEAS